jgi:hypothetical protein
MFIDAVSRILCYVIICLTLLLVGVQIGKRTVERPPKTWNLPTQENLNAESHERRF